jgi:hypothetical protein
MHLYEVRPRKDRRGFDLTCQASPFGRLWYDGRATAANAVGYAQFYRRSHRAVIRVFDATGAIHETHEHSGDFKEA